MSNIEATYNKAKQMHFSRAVIADIELEMNKNVLMDRRPRSVVTARKLFPQEVDADSRPRAYSAPALPALTLAVA